MRLLRPLLLSTLLGSVASSSESSSRSPPPGSWELNASYSFEDYVSDFGKPYSPDTDEWERRRRVFYVNLRAILRHNAALYDDDDDDYYYEEGGRDELEVSVGGGDIGAGRRRNTNKIGRPTHSLGLNRFTDMEAGELPLGYVKGGRGGGAGLGSMPRRDGGYSLYGPEHGGSAAYERRLDHAADDDGVGARTRKDLPFDVDPVSSLPPRVDWRERGVVSPVKDQGGCGSCWAFASIAALESNVALETGVLFDLSPQELVSCVPNPRHCGGRGGCSGSTAEVAFEFVATEGNGAVQEVRTPGASGSPPRRPEIVAAISRDSSF